MSMTQLEGRQIRALSGDISGTGDAVSVDKIKGTPVSATAPTPGQVLSFNGSQWAPATGGGGGVSGSGTAGRLAKWSAGTTLSDSVLVDDGTNIGINVTTPSERLVIGGNAMIVGSSSGPGASGALYFGPNSSTRKFALIHDGAGDLSFYRNNGSWAEVARIDNSTSIFNHFGPIKIVDGTQGASKVLTSDANGLASWQASGGGADFNRIVTAGGNVVVDNSGNVVFI